MKCLIFRLGTLFGRKKVTVTHSLQLVVGRSDVVFFLVFFLLATPSLNLVLNATSKRLVIVQKRNGNITMKQNFGFSFFAQMIRTALFSSPGYSSGLLLWKRNWLAVQNLLYFNSFETIGS